MNSKIASLSPSVLAGLNREDLEAVVRAMAEEDPKTCCVETSSDKERLPKKPVDPDGNIDAMGDRDLDELLASLGVEGFARLFEDTHPTAAAVLLPNDLAAATCRGPVPESPRVPFEAPFVSMVPRTAPVPAPAVVPRHAGLTMGSVEGVGVEPAVVRTVTDVEVQAEVRRRYVHWTWRLGSYTQGHNVRITRENDAEGNPLWQDHPRVEGRHNGPGCVGAIYFADFSATRTVRTFSDGSREEGEWRVSAVPQEHRFHRYRTWLHQDSGGPGQGWNHGPYQALLAETLAPEALDFDQIGITV